MAIEQDERREMNTACVQPLTAAERLLPDRSLERPQRLGCSVGQEMDEMRT
jgi:hypothetical protein